MNDFKIINVEGLGPQRVPADATDEDIARLLAQIAPPPRQRTLAELAGVGTRAVIKAGAAIPAMMADAVTGPLNFAQDKLLGEGRGIRFQAQMPQVDAALDRMGLPRPRPGFEAMASAGLEMGLGAGGTAKLADIASRGAQSVFRGVMGQVAANPAEQVAAGFAGGVAGQHAQEQGAGWTGQALSTALGAIGGSAAASKGLAPLVSRATPANLPQPMAGRDMIERTTEARVRAALAENGIDLSSLNPAVTAAIMQDATRAMSMPGVTTLDAAALARLADYRRLGAVPTVGRITGDPFDVTREQNAMRLAAATGTREAQLPQIAQGNNAALLNWMERFLPLRDRAGLGEAGMAPIRARNASLEAAKTDAYRQAEEMAGGTVPLNPGAVFPGIYARLDERALTPFLPEKIAGVMRQMATGEMPFDLRSVETLRKMVNADARAGSGSGEAALGELARMLDDIPLVANKPTLGPGPANAATANYMRMMDEAPAQLQEALQRARRANSAWRRWQESDPLIQRVVEGRQIDDTFIDTILAKGTSWRSAQRLAELAGDNTAAREAIRSGIAQKLKDAAIGAGNEAQTANFSGRGWAKAIDMIGERKLAQFFDADEIATMRSMGRVGAIETFQPRGSAVNNSNTAAGVAGLLTTMAPHVKRYLPGAGPLVADQMNSIGLTLTERGVQNITPALLQAIEREAARRGGVMGPTYMPALLGTGLAFEQ